MREFPRLKLKYVATSIVKKQPYEAVDLPYVGLEHITAWTGEIRLDEGVVPEGTVSLFEPGDILFGKLRPYLAKVALADFRGACSTEALVLRPKPGMSPRFLRYVLVDAAFIDLVDASTYGAKMPRASWEFVGSRLVPVPDLPSQQRIADFLDRETARIDQLIEKKQRMVMLLQEKRASAITRAVTKGLRADIPTKDSGVLWLGDIPAHWNCIPLRHLFTLLYRYPTYYGISYVPEGVPEVRGEALTESGRIHALVDQRYISPEDNSRFPRTVLELGDLVMSVRGTIGKLGLVDQRYVGANITANLLRMVPNRGEAESEYLFWALTSTYFKHQLEVRSPQTTIRTITVPTLLSIPIPMPPLPEQRSIVEFLLQETDRIDAIGSRANQSVERLRELRTSLITAAVTGQIDPDTWRKRGDTDRRLEAIEEEASL